MTLLCHLFLNFWMNTCQFCYLLNEDEMLYRILLNLPNLVELRRGDFLADALGEYKFLFYFIVSLLLLLNWDWTLSLYFIYMILKLANHVNDNHTFVSMKANLRIVLSSTYDVLISMLKSSTVLGYWTEAAVLGSNFHFSIE